MLRAPGRRLEEPLPRRPLQELDLRRLLRRVLEGQQPLAIELARLRRLGRRPHLHVPETRQLGRIAHDERALLGGGEELLLERGAQRRLLLVEGAQRGLVGLGELGPGADEDLVDALDEVLGLGVQRVAAGVHGLHAGEEPRVQVDRVVVRRELRRERLLDLLQGVVRVRLGHGEEDVGRAREVGAAPLHGDDGVVERGGVGQRRDGGDLGEVLPHGFDDGGLVVAVLDVIERGRLVLERARLGEGIHGLRSRWRWGGDRRGQRRRGGGRRRYIRGASGEGEARDECEAERSAHAPCRLRFLEPEHQLLLAVRLLGVDHHVAAVLQRPE